MNYSPVKHFRHLMTFKPLTFALHFDLDTYSPQNIAHLNYVTQETTSIRLVKCTKNELTNVLSISSLATLQLLHGVDISAMAAGQRQKFLSLSELASNIFHLPFMPTSMSSAVINSLQRLSHPGIRASQKLLAEEFAWPDMNKGINTWIRA
ncbi:unnamed protein product [Schistocephalus solidus]|uniref:Integrase_H2C2 domain-containing protein n=1 Tax=Schistocephalus solidus TaxID=70667 RepID=A0A3P7DLZ9_SCHSO|nr:unnamed protein product [Schistocephalus solidus]